MDAPGGTGSLAAERTLGGPEPLSDAAVFHAQQSAEKALKAFLAAHRRAFAKTHDLDLLVRQCYSIDPEFARFLHAATMLTPYAVRFRYPGGPLEPELAEAQQALRMAQEVLGFVGSKLGF